MRKLNESPYIFKKFTYRQFTWEIQRLLDFIIETQKDWSQCSSNCNLSANKSYFIILAALTNKLETLTISYKSRSAYSEK